MPVASIVGAVFGAIFLALLIFWLVGERGRLLRSSSWKILRAGGLRNLLNLNLLHLYLYGRWTKQYLGYQKKTLLPKMRSAKKKPWADRTHFKVLTPGQAGSIVALETNIVLRNQEQVIPFRTARDIILNGPPEIAAYECGCRKSSPNPCRPSQVCLVVGQPFVDFILEHHPKDSRRVGKDEALAIIEAEHKRGHVQTAWFKEICLERFYAICNCCKCCCVGIQAVTRHGIPMAAGSGYVARVNEADCQACAVCEEACPFGAIRVEDRAVVDWEKCLGCGVCQGQCPNGAVKLARDEKKGLPMDIRLMAG